MGVLSSTVGSIRRVKIANQLISLSASQLVSLPPYGGAKRVSQSAGQRVSGTASQVRVLLFWDIEDVFEMIKWLYA